MWILIADGLLQALNSVGYFAQGFADDFSALVAGRNLSTVFEVMQVALKRIEKWCVASRLIQIKQRWSSVHTKES